MVLDSQPANSLYVHTCECGETFTKSKEHLRRDKVIHFVAAPTCDDCIRKKALQRHKMVTGLLKQKAAQDLADARRRIRRVKRSW